MQNISCVVGVDFGTTSMSGVVIDIENKKIIKTLTYDTDAYITLADERRKEQSLEKLSALFSRLLAEVDSLHGVNIVGYGFTGQMHGIIGLNGSNEAVTNLITWQDMQGDIELPEGLTVLKKIKELSGSESLANGYGIVSIYKLLHLDKRSDIAGFCNVADYFANQLVQKFSYVMNPTMAHSIGLFNLNTNDWDAQAFASLGLEGIKRPQIVPNSYIIGNTENGIPVAVGIGDNQASFMGSVSNYRDSILLNVGTGTQLSFLIKKEELMEYSSYIDGRKVQIRPFDSFHYLIVTSFLNGGAIYKSLFKLFKDVGHSLLNLENIDEETLWANMEKAGNEVDAREDRPQVIPTFDRERNNENLRGSISNITSTNFTVNNLIYSFLEGLAAYYHTGLLEELKDRVQYVCGSGNGLKKNELFTTIIEKEFDKPLLLTPYQEEAAVGAAVNAITACNLQILGEPFLNSLTVNT